MAIKVDRQLLDDLKDLNPRELARELAEFEVSQLADGTLPPDRIAAVEARIAADVSLQALYAELRQTDALLRREPEFDRIDFAAMTDRVMHVVHLDQELERSGTEPAPLRLQPAATQAPAAGRWKLWGNGWATATAAAAALAVGLSLGLLMMNATGPTADPSLAVELGASTDGGNPTKTALADAQLLVSGPALPDSAALLADAAAGEEAIAVLSVAGPDSQIVFDPNAQRAFPDHPVIYSSSAVVQTPSSRMIASATTE